MAKHGVYVTQQATAGSEVTVAESGIPFVIGTAPLQAAEAPAAVGVPILVTGWADFVKKFGYSDDWEKYTLCEFAYSHFQLYGCAPAIFCNLVDPATMSAAVTAADMTVSDHRVKLPIEAINDSTLVVKPAGGSGTAYVKGTDYTVYYDGEYCVVEALSSGGCYSATSLNVAYKGVVTTSINAAAVATGMQAIDLCMNTVGHIPDLICAPGWSDVSSVAAVMATKAESLNGVFKCKAVVDLSTAASGGADSYDEVASVKAAANLSDEDIIVCWPLAKLGERTFHMSTHVAGLMAKVDTDNGGCPYESPSNKSLKIDSLLLASGAVVKQTKAQADTVVAAGVVTALNFLSSGWVCWGNYTAAYPDNADLKDYFIPISRMFGWVGNTLVQSFWKKLDKPMNRRLVDTILDACNIWLNGLVGSGYMLGARAVMLDDENPLEDLMAGIMKIHIYMTPPSPAQEIDFTLEYDASYVSAAFQG